MSALEEFEVPPTRWPLGLLETRLAEAGFTVAWPGCWHCVAASLWRGDGVPPRPSAYDPELLGAVWRVDAELGRALMREAAGWGWAPHDDLDFHAVLGVWEHGHEPDPDAPGGAGDEDHCPAYDLGGFGWGRRRVEIAWCRDCALPVWATGTRYVPEDQLVPWRRIWPATTPWPADLAAIRDGRLDAGPGGEF